MPRAAGVPDEKAEAGGGAGGGTLKVARWRDMIAIWRVEHESVFFDNRDGSDRQTGGEIASRDVG
jgi:hypothetical protein